MAKSKLSRKLDKKEPTKKVPFNLPEPNDDLAAFGWSMDRLRYPTKDSTKTDVWPGKSVFEIEEAAQLKEQYGFNIDFINAKFVQVMLDSSAAVRNAAVKCHDENYSPESRARLKRVVLKEFETAVLPTILERFKNIAGLVADFYAARLAHVITFGDEEET